MLRVSQLINIEAQKIYLFTLALFVSSTLLVIHNCCIYNANPWCKIHIQQIKNFDESLKTISKRFWRREIGDTTCCKVGERLANNLHCWLPSRLSSSKPMLLSLIVVNVTIYSTSTKPSIKVRNPTYYILWEILCCRQRLGKCWQWQRQTQR